VFEDLHWADPALLAFPEHLADWAEGVPLLLLCTSRPELYERHATFGADARNAQRINLGPLSDTETAQLVSALLERSVLPAETQQQLLEQAGGNPLYAEEFVRLLADKGELGDGGVPESVQALIAARLDTLPPERKALLQDAAVVGKVFWAGALAAMGDRDPAKWSRRCTSSGARSSSASPARARWKASASTPSGTCSCETSATAKSRVSLARRATRQPPPGWKTRPVNGWRTSPTYSRTTTSPHSS
jgi:hypothetical protein